MLRQFVSILIPTRGIKHTVNVKWVKPPFFPAYTPVKSGDLEGLPPIPESALGQDYALTEEIKDAPESVKKIFSVGHLGRKEYNILVKKELIDRVRRHQYDFTTAETKIAFLTGQIRYLQNIMEKFPRNKEMKQLVQERIDRRKKLLKYLRRYDYKKFEWLLEQLNIEYKGHPDTLHRLSRKESLRKLTEMHCEDIRNKKLADYRNLLESQQGPFLKQKLENLKFIKSEQLELKLPVTVTDQEISKVEEQLKEWTIKDEIKKKAQKKNRNALLEDN